MKRVGGLLLLLVSCGGSAAPASSMRGATEPFAHSPAPQPGALPADETGATRPREQESPQPHVKIRYELGGRAFPLPLVRGSIGGEPTWMLVDTGANSHVIAGWLARKAKLDMKNVGDQGTDHAGHPIVTSRVERARMTLDGWGPLPEIPTLVTEIPEAVARIGIGAFVSPQLLALAARAEGGKNTALVLDLARAEMYAMDPSHAAGELEGKGANPFVAAARVCEDRASSIYGLAFVVPATIEGASVSLLLDTGAHRSDLLAGSAVARRFLPRSVPSGEQVYAASGKISTRIVRGAKVNVGAHSAVTDVDILPGESDPSCPRDGALAMDILKSCIMIFERDTVRGRCAGGPQVKPAAAPAVKPAGS